MKYRRKPQEIEAGRITALEFTGSKLGTLMVTLEEGSVKELGMNHTFGRIPALGDYWTPDKVILAAEFERNYEPV